MDRILARRHTNDKRYLRYVSKDGSLEGWGRRGGKHPLGDRHEKEPNERRPDARRHVPQHPPLVLRNVATPQHGMPRPQSRVGEPQRNAHDRPFVGIRYPRQIQDKIVKQQLILAAKNQQHTHRVEDRAHQKDISHAFVRLGIPLPKVGVELKGNNGRPNGTRQNVCRLDEMLTDEFGHEMCRTNVLCVVQVLKEGCSVMGVEGGVTEQPCGWCEQYPHHHLHGKVGHCHIEQP